MKDKHEVLATYTYEPTAIERGYNNRSLYISVGGAYDTHAQDPLTHRANGARKTVIGEKAVTDFMKRKFTGGKGFGLYQLWKAVEPDTRWNAPENNIVISPGPLAGITQYPGAGKSLVCCVSAVTNLPIDSNVGGHFGPFLKFAGFDILELQGKSEEEIIIFIDGNARTVRIETAPMEAIDSHILCEQLYEMYAENEKDKENISIISSGRAAENALIGMLNFSFWDKRRGCVRLKQAGRGGIGTVLRHKKIKAVVIRYRGVHGDLNHPANKSLLNAAGVRMHREIARNDHLQNNMRKIGTANIIDVMDRYDLLPVHNFQYGSHPDTAKISSKVFIEKYVTQNVPDGCWYGCSMSCAKAVDSFELRTGPYRGSRVCVDGPEYENAAALGSNVGCFDPHWVLEGNFYCDTYGLDTISMGTMTAFAMECFERGLINLDDTEGLDLCWGSGEAILELMHQMAVGRGFGMILGKGIRQMKRMFAERFGKTAPEYDLEDIPTISREEIAGWPIGKPYYSGDPVCPYTNGRPWIKMTPEQIKDMEDFGMENKGLEYSEYMMKESPAQQAGYALCNKGPQHDEAWLIFMDMVNNQIPTFEDKAEALHWFPMFRTWFSLLGLCKLPWVDIVPPDNKYTLEPHKIPGHIQNYIDIYEGVLGERHTEASIVRQSERVYTFQRIFILRMGSGQRKHDAPPARSIGPITACEYLSRRERYDKQLKELAGADPEGRSTGEKIEILMKYRKEQFWRLAEAAYKRRGWTPNGIPRLVKLIEIEMDLPELVRVVRPYLKEEGCWPEGGEYASYERM